MKTRILALLGVLVVGSLLAVAAAQLNVGSDDLGAGVSVVASCDTDGVNVEYDVEWGTNSSIELPGEFAVTTITVTDIAPACEGQALLAGLIDGSGSQLGFIIPTEITSDTATAFVVRPSPPDTCMTSPDPSWMCMGVSANQLEKVGVIITSSPFL